MQDFAHNRLVVNGLDLTELGIGDVVGEEGPGPLNVREWLEMNMVREILGSITFGPVGVVGVVFEEEEDDRDYDRPFSD